MTASQSTQKTKQQHKHKLPRKKKTQGKSTFSSLPGPALKPKEEKRRERETKKQQKDERHKQYHKEKEQKEEAEKAILAQKNPFSVFKKDDEEDDMDDDSVVFTDSSSSDHLPKGTLFTITNNLNNKMVSI